MASITLSLLQPEGANSDTTNAEAGTPITATLTDPDEDATAIDQLNIVYQWFRGKVSDPTPNPANDALNLIDDWLEATGTGGDWFTTYMPNADDVSEYLLVRATYMDNTPPSPWSELGHGIR